jgi:hypothetical protein
MPAGLVGADDVMPQILWTLYFLEAQGYKIQDNILYQDNKSAILLESNGRGSSGKRTRHINVRYFFIADRVKSKEIRIAYCPTGVMIADYFTKPLQGLLFRQLRDMIMGNTPIALPEATTTTSQADDLTDGIPVTLASPESRSVLVDELKGSPGSILAKPKHVSTVLTVLGKLKTGDSISVLPVFGNDNVRRRRPVLSKRILSWADIVDGRKSE